MHDLNFFSILKQQSKKSKATRIIIASIILLVVVLNALLVAFGLYSFNQLEDKIESNKSYIDSADTKAKVRDAEILNEEANIASDYLTILQKASANIDQADTINVALMDYLRSLAPAATIFVNVEYSGINIDMSCLSSNQEDPILYYHQLLRDDRFSYVSIPSIDVTENNQYDYKIVLQLKGVE